MNPITLVIMAPSGETFVTRDASGRLWLHQPEGAGGAGEVDDATVQRAIGDHGFVRIDREFANWDALDSFREARAALVTPAVVVDADAFDLHDVDRMLAVAREWRDEGDLTGAWRLVTELLRVPAVRADDGTNEALVEFLAELSQPASPAPPPAASPLVAKARQRWQQVQNAA